MNKAFKAVTVLAIVSMLAGLLGCKSRNEYTVADIESLSISCGHMDLRKSYSFGISLKDGAWILYADCFASDGETQIKIETPVKTEEAEKLLSETEKSGFIASLQKYKKPLFKPDTADETVYSSRITFSDGNEISAQILASQNIENIFYALAEKYR